MLVKNRFFFISALQCVTFKRTDVYR